MLRKCVYGFQFLATRAEPITVRRAIRSTLKAHTLGPPALALTVPLLRTVHTLRQLMLTLATLAMAS